MAEVNNSTSSLPNYECHGATDDELALFSVLSWWVGGLFHILVCLVGLASNGISILVLCSKAMYTSTFNRLLAILAICDNVYLVFALLECLRQEMGMSSSMYNKTFVHALYPCHNITLCISIYMTVVMAMERYRAVTQPVDYHATIASGRQWPRVLRYIVPVFVFCVLFNVPKFFELTTDTVTITNPANPEETFTKTSIIPTKVRLDDTYTTYYHNHARLVVTGLIPLVALGFFNYRIYCNLKQRRQNLQGLQSTSNSAHTQHAAEENRHAFILFAIVALFLICHVPRNFLNVHEVLTFEQKKQDYFHGCGGMPLWILLIGLFSHLLLSLNASLNFFLYCAMSQPFRTELKALVRKWTNFCCNNNNNNSSSGREVQAIKLTNFNSAASV